MTSFETAAVVLGAVLMGGALLSGLAHRSFLSLTALFVIVGFVLGDGGLHVIELDPESGFVVGLAEVALIVLLFRDGLEVESELLQRAWRLPLRKLVIGMPITAAVVALAARALTDLSWTEAFLLGALLSPTDPVLSSAVVTNPRVPRVVRHSLNLESGLNDGLALPPVLALIAALSLTREDFHVVTFVVQDVGLGLVFGLAMGWLASVLMPRGAAIPTHQKSLYALGVAFATYGVSVLEPHGNGFIAVYVAAIVLGTRRADLRAAFEQRSDDIVELVKLGIFVVFGSLLTLDGLFGDGWAAVAIVVVALLVARPVALAVALAGTRLSLPVKAFMAWFGPKGVATMTFSIIVLGAGLANGERIFNLAALVVFVSIIAHSTTDTAGVNWIARHDAAQREGEDRAAGDGERVRPGSE
ncbi:MAG: cation:proton antiporter [Solirubrobacteraceae bacterium]